MNPNLVRIFLIVIIAMSGIAGTLYLFASGRLGLPISFDDGISRAAIIDQLHDDIPSASFQEKATEYLTSAGYKVDLYTTEDVTIDFYKNLPTKGYKFIVIRSHSGIGSGTGQTIENTLGIFTGEKYDEKIYTFEQIFGWVQKSRAFTEEYEARFERGGTNMTLSSLEESDTYFSIGSKFINEYMIGKFPGSIIMIGGCNTLENSSLAEALVKRGASSVIGWDRLVEAGHNDRAILETLRSMLVDKADAKEAIQSAMQMFGPDPQYSAKLNYYPRDSAKA